MKGRETLLERLPFEAVASPWKVARTEVATQPKPFIETGAGRASWELLDKLEEELHKKGDKSATVVLEDGRFRLRWEIRPNNNTSSGFEYRGIGLFSLSDGLLDIEYTRETGWVDAKRYMRYGVGVWLRNLIVSQANGWSIDSATELVRSYMDLAKHHSYVK